MLAAYLIENIEVSGFTAAFFAAAAIGVLNLFFRPFLIILTLPINIMTMGLFTFVINALMLKIASGIMGPAFTVTGFWSTVFGAVVISAVSWILNNLLADASGPRGPGPGRPGGQGKGNDHIDLEKKGDRWE